MTTGPDQNQGNGTNGNRPWAELRSGLLKLTIWENANTQGVVYHSSVLVRLYRDQREEWQETSSLGRDDLLRAGNLLRRGFDMIESEEQRRRETQTD